MTQSPKSYFEQLGEAWNQFWFSPANARPLTNVRIVTTVGFLIYLATWGNLTGWLASDGYFPAETAATIAKDMDGRTLVFRGGFLPGFDAGVMLQIYRGLMLVTATCLLFGVAVRIAAISTWLLVLFFVHRFGFVAGPCEQLLTTLLFYIALHPGTNGWSLLPQSAPTDTTPTVFANIVQRMLQIHLAVLVLTMAQTKLAGPAWWNGDAVWFLTARTLTRPLDLTGLRSNELLTNLWTHFIVFAELLFPVFVWHRLSRPIALVAVMVAWLSLPLLTGDWLLPLFLAAGLLAFWPQDGEFRRVTGS